MKAKYNLWPNSRCTNSNTKTQAWKKQIFYKPNSSGPLKEQHEQNSQQQTQKNGYKYVQSNQSTHINWINSSRIQTAEPNKEAFTIQQRDRNKKKTKLKSSLPRLTNRIGRVLEAVPGVMLGVSFPSLQVSSFSGSAGVHHLFYFCKILISHPPPPCRQQPPPHPQAQHPFLYACQTLSPTSMYFYCL